MVTMGFTPEEVKIISDHRYVPIIRDAQAWRNHQAALKAAEGKKVPAQQPKGTLRPTGNASGTVASDQKSNVLNRARNTDDMRTKAALIASTL